MPLKEEFPLRYLDAEALFLVNMSQVGRRKMVLIIL
jgi:hypothetical protein